MGTIFSFHCNECTLKLHCKPFLSVHLQNLKGYDSHSDSYTDRRTLMLESPGRNLNYSLISKNKVQDTSTL